MDEKKLKRPSSNLNWLWWSLGAFFTLVFTFQLGVWTAGDSSEGLGKKVGIINIVGPIVSAEPTVKELEKLRKRGDVAAIVIRIDSPGGLVAPTQEIYEKVKSVRIEKPIVASMATVAASGGYYIALGGDTIIANPGTIVGSIGVVINYPIMTELLEKVGVEFETVKSGELKDVGSYSRKVTDADRVHLNEMVDDMYDQFVTAVTDNRPISKEKVITLADGRVYTGLKSKELGLIDLIGTFEDAIKMAGSMGQLGCFSLHPLKNLNGAGDAGAIVTSDSKLAEKLLLLRNHGLRSRDEFLCWGYNSRLDSLQASILNCRLPELSQVIEQRRHFADIYRNKLRDVVFCPDDAVGCYDTYHLFVIQTPQRDKLKSFLEKKEIQTSIHYPVPIHLQPGAEYLGYRSGSFVNVEKQSKQILSLPIHNRLTVTDVELVADSILEFFKNEKF